MREIKARRRPGSVRAAGSACGSGERGDHACGRYLTDDVVAGIAHIDIARAVGGDAARVIKSRRSPGSIGAPDYAARTRERGDNACGRDLADGVVAFISHIGIAGTVESDAEGGIEACRGPGSVGAANDAGGTGERGDYARGCDLADGVVVGIGHIDIARAVGSDAGRKIKARRRPGAVGAANAPCRPGKRGHHCGGCDLADGVVA